MHKVVAEGCSELWNKHAEAHHGSLGVPEHEARPRSLADAEQAQLLAKLPVVPAHHSRIQGLGPWVRLAVEQNVKARGGE